MLKYYGQKLLTIPMNPGPLNLAVTFPSNRQCSATAVTTLLTALQAIRVAAEGNPNGMKIGFNSVTIFTGGNVIGDAHAVCMLDAGPDRSRLKALKAATVSALQNALLLAPLKCQWYITEYSE